MGVTGATWTGGGGVERARGWGNGYGLLDLLQVFDDLVLPQFAAFRAIESEVRVCVQVLVGLKHGPETARDANVKHTFGNNIIDVNINRMTGYSQWHYGAFIQLS